MNEAGISRGNRLLAPQIIYTSESRVACNGGGGALGHPRIWLTLGSDGQVICPYCSRHFVTAESQPEDL